MASIDLAYFLRSDDTMERLQACAKALHELHSRFIQQSNNRNILQTTAENIMHAMRNVVGSSTETQQQEEEEEVVDMARDSSEINEEQNASATADFSGRIPPDTNSDDVPPVPDSDS